MEPILTFAIGLLLGLGVGVISTARTFLRQRAARGMATSFARLWPDSLPSRSAADILAGRVRVFLGGQVYDLPVLPRAASRRWLESLDGRFADLTGDLEAAGDDAPRILSRLAAETDGLYDLLLSYDQSGVLPPRDAIDETATDTQILRAVLEVWRAAHPLAATLAHHRKPDDPPTGGTLPVQPSGPRSPMDGGLTSSTSAPTSKSSRTSTPATSASKTTSTRKSKPRGLATSSPTTSKRGESGGGSPAPIMPSAPPPSAAPLSSKP